MPPEKLVKTGKYNVGQRTLKLWASCMYSVTAQEGGGWAAPGLESWASRSSRCPAGHLCCPSSPSPPILAGVSQGQVLGSIPSGFLSEVWTRRKETPRSRLMCLHRAWLQHCCSQGHFPALGSGV